MKTWKRQCGYRDFGTRCVRWAGHPDDHVLRVRVPVKPMRRRARRARKASAK